MSETGYNMEMAEESGQLNKLSDWPSPGQKMKKLREEIGLSHGSVAEALHMTTHYVRSLESDNYEKLPGKTFVKGYFKAYAKLLNADVNEVLECYEQYVIALEASQENEADEIRAKKTYDQNLRWMICAAIIIVLVVGISWWFSRNENASASIVRPVQDTLAEVAVSGSDPVTAEVLMANLGDSRGESGQITPFQNAQTVVVGGPEKVTSIDVRTDGRTDEREEQKVNAWDEAVIEVAMPDAMPDVTKAELETANTIIQDVFPPEKLPGDNQSLELVSSVDASMSIPQVNTVNRFEDYREVQLESEGDDFLEIHFSGASWIEVDDVDNVRLYHDMFNTGDDLTIRGSAPFNILVGDANMVEMTFNSKVVDVMTRIRTDNTVRLILAPESR
jgi:cytoskeleton protein RodZ